MSSFMTPELVRTLRIRAQYLSSKANPGDLASMVGMLSGVNAQSTPAMMLSLRARIKGLELADIKKEMGEKRNLVRTWTMRGTLHLIDTHDLGWIVSLLGPTIIKKGSGRRLELGLDNETIARGMDEIRAILDESGPQTRDELIKILIDRGIEIDGTSQAPYHLLAYAGLNGIICIGPDSPDGKQTYDLVTRWARAKKSSMFSEPLPELAYRYLKGYAPASPEDFSSWSGLSLSDARKGWDQVMEQELLNEINVEGNTLWCLKSQCMPDKEPGFENEVVNLLPAFDTYILGYSDREYVVPAKYRNEIYHGGQTVPVVLVNGSAVGAWRYRRQGKGIKISISPFEPFNDTTKILIEEESNDIGRFLGLHASVFYTDI